ncbi:hypothetical protein TNCV_4972541 [Trichonephila clavipes]|nr:hypothetical protein TNCV_4972541 [Trichonephila clavipes]
MTRSVTKSPNVAAEQCDFNIHSLTHSLGDCPIRWYLCSSLLDGRAYLIFLPQVLSELLDAASVSPSLRRCMRYQLDGTPVYYGIHVHKKHINVTFEQW